MHLHDLAQICPFLRNHVKFSDSFTNESIYDTIQEVALKLQRSDLNCFNSMFLDCFDWLKPLITEDGYCFTFNALNAHDMYTNE